MSDRSRLQKEIIADEQIINLYWERNDRAIKLTDDKYGKFLYCIAYNILQDRLDCEECRNDTYLGIWNSIPPNRPNSFIVFISKIMRNIAMKKYRDKTRKKRIPSELTVSIDDLHDALQSDDTPHKMYLAKELGKVINEYIEGLTERQRYIFIGRFYMGDTLEAIAEKLHVNVSTVHREIEKIKLDLKSYLERNDIYV